MNSFAVPDYAAAALTALCDAGCKAYLIGGCVRDALMGRTPSDYDITTNALPEQVISVFSNFPTIETGLKHGTVTVIIDGKPLEITTFRAEGPYSDHRRPDSVSFSDTLADDAARRDFTVNAIAFSPDEGIVDLYGGSADIAAGIIRCVGNPKERFSEDALRILRAVRFSSVLGFDIEPGTKKAMLDCKNNLRFISPERCFEELKKLLLGKNAEGAIIENAEILGVVLPEILPMINFDQRNPHHIYDLLTHTAKAVAAAPFDIEIRLAALFHDIGKPRCFTLDENGIGHFFGHADISADMAREILNRLRSDNKTIHNVCRLIHYHDGVINETEKAVCRRINQLSEDLFVKLLELQKADNSAQSPELSYRGEHYVKIYDILHDVIAKKECTSLKMLAVNGVDMISAGLKNREIGAALNFLLEAVLEGKVKNEKNELMLYLKNPGITKNHP